MRDVRSSVSRRKFLRTSTVAAASAILPFGAVTYPVAATEHKLPKSETLVKTLYASLSEKQRSNVCFDFDHKLRHEIENNWFIVKDHRVGKSYNKDQQAMIREIFMNMHSEEYDKKVMKQVKDDHGRGGFGDCSIALFGEPDTGKFEFVLTGRHTTRRCDGDSVEGTAFGGPIFTGMQLSHSTKNPTIPATSIGFRLNVLTKFIR